MATLGAVTLGSTGFGEATQGIGIYKLARRGRARRCMAGSGRARFGMVTHDAAPHSEIRLGKASQGIGIIISLLGGT